MEPLKYRSVFARDPFLTPPYTFDGVLSRVILLAAGSRQLKKILDEFLNEVGETTGSGKRYTPLSLPGAAGKSPLCLRLSMYPDDIGIPGAPGLGNEASLTIPAMELDHGTPNDFVFFSPWGAASSVDWMVTGREVLGEPRVLGDVQLSDDLTGPCTVSTPEPHPTPLIEVKVVDTDEGQANEDPHPCSYQSLLIDHVSKEERQRLEKNIEHGREPRVGLKQLPHVERAGAAGHRELTKFLVTSQCEASGTYTPAVFFSDAGLRERFGITADENHQVEVLGAGWYVAQLRFIRPRIVAAYAAHETVSPRYETPEPCPLPDVVTDWVSALVHLHRAHVRLYVSLMYPWCYWIPRAQEYREKY